MVAKSVHIKRPTSADVARLAGVSRTTVSLVLNNSLTANISAETRARIYEAVAQLDYHPHEAARSLRSQASHLIGVAIPDSNNPHYLQLVAGMDTYARSKGYNLLLSITNYTLENEKSCFEWLRQKRIDALILISGTGRALLNEIHALCEQGYPITNLSFRDVNMFDANIDSIVPEAQRGEHILLEYLLGFGHRRIGYIYGVAKPEMLSDRLNACLQFQQERGLPILEDWICRCGPTPEESYQATQALLAKYKGVDRPTALVVVNDLLAMGVLAALAAAQVRVPDDMSVVSFDNTPLAPYTHPPLTTIDYDALAMGETAARLTIERLTTPERPSVYVEMPAKLVVRGSTKESPETLK